MLLVGNVFQKRSKWFLGLPMTVRELWARDYHDSRIILEQQGYLRYFSVTARLQRNVVRGLIVLGLAVVSGFIVLAIFSLLLMAGNAKLERSHHEIFEALIGSAPDISESGGRPISREDMLELARSQIAEKGLQDRIRLIHCPIQDLKAHVTGTFDLVLCHAVLEWLAEPRQTLLGLFPFVKAGGILSLLFYNRHGLLFQSLVVGNFDYVRLGLRKKRQLPLTPTNPQLPEQVYDWIGRGGLKIIGKTGVRVIHDYMRNRQDQSEKFDDLLAMEQQYCRQEPFVGLGRYIHVMAQKPAS